MKQKRNYNLKHEEHLLYAEICSFRIGTGLELALRHQELSKDDFKKWVLGHRALIVKQIRSLRTKIIALTQDGRARESDVPGTGQLMALVSRLGYEQVALAEFDKAVTEIGRKGNSKQKRKVKSEAKKLGIKEFSTKAVNLITKAIPDSNRQTVYRNLKKVFPSK